MIILNRAEIEALIDFPRAAEAIEGAYRAVSSGEVNLPPVGHITFPDHDGDCHIKYGHIAGDGIFVIKVATGFAGNEALGLANGNGVTLVLSARTGAVRAVLHDEMMMTDIRTGIGGAIASRALARPDASRVLIVGTGEQARRQVEAHAALLGSEVRFELWGRSAEKAGKVVAGLCGSCAITRVGDLAAACGAADIIVTTTGATAPFIRRDWVRAGTHITAVGADAPGKRELDSALVTAADGLFADLASQCLDHGELATAYAAGLIDAGRVTDLGDVLLDPARGRKAATDITIADLTGIAAQDIAIAKVVLAAHETGSGDR